MSQLGGDMDFRGFHNLPPNFYHVATELKKGEVSGVLKTPEAVHLIQLTERKPYGDSFAPYLQLLKAKYRNDHEEEFLSKKLADLKKKAKIEVLRGTDNP